MERDLTTPTDRQNAADGGQRPRRLAGRFWSVGDLAGQAAGLAVAMALGLLLFALLYQFPATHDVDIGGYDEAYVQGFYDPEPATAPL
ncbi:MAG TPA: hypothetical protein VFX76_02225, partial [Roseiflexaceae bacterium]|nr:hypothetical protein [Roseiflexaceae bacterium]